MPQLAPPPDDVRFSLDDHLRDPLVRKGYEDQGPVVEAARMIREMRDAAGLSQLALAARIGSSQAHLSLLERGDGRQGPTFSMLRKIAAACGQDLQITWRSSKRSENKAIGSVKWFDTTKGFGFIMPQDGGKDVFVHITEVQAAGLPGLNEGQKISYDVTVERGKAAASRLKIF